MPKQFIAITLTNEIEQCAACRILLKRGTGAMLSGKDTFVCDTECLRYWRDINETTRYERRENYLAQKFN